MLKAKWFDVGTVERLNELNTYLQSHDGWGQEQEQEHAALNTSTL